MDLGVLDDEMIIGEGLRFAVLPGHMRLGKSSPNLCEYWLSANVTTLASETSVLSITCER